MAITKTWEVNTLQRELADGYVNKVIYRVDGTDGTYKTRLTGEVNLEKPKTPKWTYIISGENALFNPSLSAGFQDFELHSSEEGILVIKILQLAGISIKDYSLTQVAAQKEAVDKQQ